MKLNDPGWLNKRIVSQNAIWSWILNFWVLLLCNNTCTTPPTTDGINFPGIDIHNHAITSSKSGSHHARYYTAQRLNGHANLVKTVDKTGRYISISDWTSDSQTPRRSLQDMPTSVIPVSHTPAATFYSAKWNTAPFGRRLWSFIARISIWRLFLPIPFSIDTNRKLKKKNRVLQ